jgi:hypothetical protein
MRRVGLLFGISILSLAACAHHAVKVTCEGPLRPINAPAPKEAAPTPSRASAKPP